MAKASQADRRRQIKRGEALAITDDAIRKDDRGAFFFLFGPSIKENERAGDDDSIAVVNVRGPIDQFDDCWGENYEAIVQRVGDAFSGEDARKAEERKRERAKWEAYYRGEESANAEEPIIATPPRAVVLRISSPGGVVAGLWETVKKLQRMSAESGVPLVCFADEMAASAAYALACACESIYVPRAGNLGSIGVISHMFSIARHNEEEGIDVEVIASGDQKADGNENLPITDDAMGRERARVMRLARQFFEIVASARSLDVEKVEALQAGLFMGKQAAKLGLADGVMGWDEAIAEISLAYGSDGVTDSMAQRGTTSATAKETSMTKLKALIAQTKKDLATATGKAKQELQAKLSRLTASLKDLEAYKKTTYEKETSEEDEAPEEDESEGDDEKEDADDDAEGDDDEKKSKKSKKADDDADAEDEESDDEAESDDDDKDAEDESSDDEAMISALTSHLKGNARAKMRGVLKAKFSDAASGRQALKETRKLARARDREQLAAIIDAKKAKHFISASEAKWLKKQPRATVESFLATRKQPMLRTDETQFIPADTGRPGMSGAITESEMAIIKRAHTASGGKVPLEQFIKDFEAGAHRPNGVKQ